MPISKPLIVTLLILISIFHISCNQYLRNIDPELINLSELMIEYPDSSLFILETQYDNTNLDEFNLAYFYLLLTENKFILNQSIIDCDTLLNWSVEHLRDNTLKAKAWLLKGKICQQLNETDNALVCLLKAKDYIKKVKSDSLLYHIYDGLGQTYTELELFRDALDTYCENFSLQLKNNNMKNITLSLRNIGYTYLIMEKSDSAFYYFDRGLNLAQKSVDSISLSDIIYSDMSVYYYTKEEYEIAISYVKKVRSKSYYTDLMTGILYSHRKQSDSAKYYLFNAIKCESIFTRASAYFYLSKTEEEQFNYKSATNYLQKYNELKDSINYVSRKENVNKLILNNLSKNIEKQYNFKFIVISCAAILTILTALFFFSFREKKKKKNLCLQNSEIKNLNLKLTEIQNKIIKIKENEKKKFLSSSSNNDILLFQKKIDDLQCRMFKTKDIYSLITNLSNQKKNLNKPKQILNRKEREILHKEIYACFPELINVIKTSYPKVKDEDLKLCCLTKLGLSLNVISLCFGFSESDPIRQRKYYLKKNMIKNLKSAEVFYSIFPEKNN